MGGYRSSLNLRTRPPFWDPKRSGRRIKRCAHDFWPQPKKKGQREENPSPVGPEANWDQPRILNNFCTFMFHTYTIFCDSVCSESSTPMLWPGFVESHSLEQLHNMLQETIWYATGCPSWGSLSSTSRVQWCLNLRRNLVWCPQKKTFLPLTLSSSRLSTSSRSSI